MTPEECWNKTRELILYVTQVPIIEAYDDRKAKDRPQGTYATLSMKKISPVGAATTSHSKNGEMLASTLSVPCEVLFEYTVHRGFSMDIGYLVTLLTVHEGSRQFQIENGISVWGVDELTRKPEKVNESYEDSVVPVLKIAATLSMSEDVNYADNVAYNINGLTGEVKPEETKELNDESKR